MCPVTLIISAYLTFLLYHCFIFNTTIPYLSDLLSKLSFGWFSVSGMGIHLFLFKTSSWLQLFTQKVLFDPLYAFLVMRMFQYGGGYQILAALYWLYHKDIDYLFKCGIFYFDQEYLLFSLAQTLSMWCHIPLEMLEPPM